MATEKALPASATTSPKIVRFQLRELAGNINGATAVEYGLLAGLVAIGIAGGLGALSDLVNLLFETIGNETATVTANMDGG